MEKILITILGVIMAAFEKTFDKLFENIGGFTILLLLCSLVYMLYHSHKAHHLDWLDLIRTKGSQNISLTKFLQLVGGITGTWMVVYTTLHNRLTYDLLLVYLAYVGAIDGWSKFISAKYNLPPPSPTKEEKREIGIKKTKEE
jgi:hypothetical protein